MTHLFKQAFNRIFKPVGYCIAHDMEKVLGRKRKLDLIPDFVRQSSIELCAEEINSKKIEGNVAELGVYQGDFASQINKLFSDRKLYLFDTFSGFDSKDVSYDKLKKYSSDNQDFSQTSIERVLEKMVRPNNCIIKQGYFPETASDVDDRFAFVSIDADLYKPIYSGLNFFYPKLVEGGYIFVHDFNNKRYVGAKEAVIIFCKENKIGYFPLSDSCGTAVLVK